MVKQKPHLPLWTLFLFTAWSSLLSSLLGFTSVNAFPLPEGSIAPSWAAGLAMSPPNQQGVSPIFRQETSDSSHPSLLPTIEFLPDLSDGGREPQREGSGSHGNCELAKEPDGRLTALVPMRDVWGKTVDGHPTFWIYVPYQVKPGADASLTFALRNATNTVIYQKTVTTNRPGIVSFRLPETEPELERDRLHNWIVIFSCGVEFTAEGSVKRVASPSGLDQELQTARTPIAQAAIYAKYGIWYEALTVLGDRRRRDPRNAELNRAWSTLLNDAHVRLNRVAIQSIVDCCTAP